MEDNPPLIESGILSKKDIKEIERTLVQDGITLPGWFLKVIGAVSIVFLGLFVPWAGWLSLGVMNLGYKVDTNSQKYSETSVKITELETRYNKDFLDLKIEITKIQSDIQKQNLLHQNRNP